MRSDRSRRVAITTEWWLSFELALFPDQFIVSVEDDKVVNVCWRDEILFASCAGVDAPASKKYYIGAADIGRVAVSGQWWSAGDSDSCPFILFSVQDADVAQIARL